MHGTLILVGALTLAAGLFIALSILMQEPTTHWLIPSYWALAGILGSLVWFALGGIVRRLDEISSRLDASRPRTEPDPEPTPGSAQRA